MRKINPARVYKEKFAGIGVTSCHFVTNEQALEQSPSYSKTDSANLIHRHYRPEPAAFEQLIEVLYQLIVVPTSTSSDFLKAPCVSRLLE